MSTIAATQIAINYRRAGQRPSCSNCGGGEELYRTGRDTGGWYCLREGFSTTALAVCSRHTFMPAFAHLAALPNADKTMSQSVPAALGQPKV